MHSRRRVDYDWSIDLDDPFPTEGGLYIRPVNCLPWRCYIPSGGSLTADGRSHATTYANQTSRVYDDSTEETGRIVDRDDG